MPGPTPRIFINYRWDDIGTDAQLIYANLEKILGKDNLVFFDRKMDKGADIPREILDALERTEILLSLIGPQWFTIEEKIDEYTRTKRLFREEDWVRRELEIALEKKIRIVPVLVKGAAWPKADKADRAFPPSLLPMHGLNFYEIHPGYIQRDLSYLLEMIGAGQAEKMPAQSGGEAILAHLPLPETYRKSTTLPKIPFSGLHYFTPDKAALFFGRDKDIAGLYQKISSARLSLLYGPSGAGKSSLLEVTGAGLNIISTYRITLAEIES